MRITNKKTEHSSSDDDSRLPNFVTIIGQGVPGNFELTVDGDIEVEAENPVEEGMFVSGNSVEGSIEVGVQRIWFSGEMANLRLLDWNGVKASESTCAPTANVTYGTR